MDIIASLFKLSYITIIHKVVVNNITYSAINFHCKMSFSKKKTNICKQFTLGGRFNCIVKVRRLLLVDNQQLENIKQRCVNTLKPIKYGLHIVHWSYPETYRRLKLKYSLCIMYELNYKQFKFAPGSE